MIKCLSFDLQGTLSNSEISNNFWLEILPQKYANKNNINIKEAKNVLKEYFKEIGIYDIKYYDDKYWSDKLIFNTIFELDSNEIKTRLNIKLLDFINTISLPKIIISTTTNLFIDYELSVNKRIFEKVYSCVDDFNIGGKSSEIYRKVLEEININPEEMLHIGDNYEMDIKNAERVGIRTILYKNNDNEVIETIKKYMEV